MAISLSICCYYKAFKTKPLADAWPDLTAENIQTDSDFKIVCKRNANKADSTLCIAPYDYKLAKLYYDGIHNQFQAQASNSTGKALLIMLGYLTQGSCSQAADFISNIKITIYGTYVLAVVNYSKPAPDDTYVFDKKKYYFTVIGDKSVKLLTNYQEIHESDYLLHVQNISH